MTPSLKLSEQNKAVFPPNPWKHCSFPDVFMATGQNGLNFALAARGFQNKVLTSDEQMSLNPNLKSPIVWNPNKLRSFPFFLLCPWPVFTPVLLTESIHSK